MNDIKKVLKDNCIHVKYDFRMIPLCEISLISPETFMDEGKCNKHCLGYSILNGKTISNKKILQMIGATNTKCNGCSNDIQDCTCEICTHTEPKRKFTIDNKDVWLCSECAAKNKIKLICGKCKKNVIDTQSMLMNGMCINCFNNS
jgi:hypothetical protein